MTDFTNILVFLLVVGLRIGVPLWIPRYPLPAMIASLVLDAVDQTIYQTFTTLNLDGYESYDKALDIYYLAIAYVSTFRNWANLSAFQTARFLWYYRLVGVAAFEISQWRPLLLVFPNTFEYFFDFYEAACTRWNPLRLTTRAVIGAAAFIWIFIKLPQEYWLHVAELDTTDVIKKDILGVPTDTGWISAISDNLWAIPVVVVIAGVAVALYRAIRKRLPRENWALTWDANVHNDVDVTVTPPPAERISLPALVEKVVLVGLIGIIFSQILPNIQASSVWFFINIAVIVAANAFVGVWLARRGHSWASMPRQFGVMAVINFGLAMVWLALVSDNPDAEDSIRVVIFFVLLLTLIVTLYDRYRPFNEQRFSAARAGRARSTTDRD